jgi:polysaccharide chain length determinant protein (PEP-CTERM system associated)
MARELLPASEESIAIRALGILRRRAAVAAVAFAAVLAAAVAFALYLPDLYRAHAIVLVERPLGDSVVRPAATASNELESRLHVIQQTILSRDRLTELINRFNLYPELRAKGSFEDVLNQARQDIQWEPNGPEQVSGRTKTVTFTLTYTGDERQTVADVTNAVAGFYVAYNDQMRAAEAQSATHFMEMQLEAAKTQVDTAEAKLRTFVAQNERLLPQSASVNAVTYTRLGDDLRRNLDQQARAADARDRLIEALNDAARTAPPASATAAAATELGVEPSKELTELTARLDKAKENLIELERKGLAEGHPDVKTTRELIASLETEVEAQRERDLAAFKQRQAAQATTTASGPQRPAPARTRSVESYDQEIDRLKKEESQIRAEMMALNQRFDSAPAVQQEYLLLQRDYQAAKDNYDVVQRRYVEAKQNEVVETSGQGERFRILEAAIPPEGPSAPNRPRLLILGFLLALAAAAAAIVAREQFDTSFHSIDELREFTAVPVLATIPVIGAAPRRGYLRMALGTATAVAAIVLVGTLSAYIANGNETLVRMLQRAG